MTQVAKLKGRADSALSLGEFQDALHGYAKMVALVPRDIHARLRVADCLLGLGHVEKAATVYTALARHAMHGGHPLTALVALKVLATLEPQLEVLLDMLAKLYASDSDRVGVGARHSLVDLHAEAGAAADLPMSGDAALIQVATDIAANTDAVGGDYPEHLPPIPLLSRLSSMGFAAVIRAFELVRAADGEVIIEQGKMGQALFMLARGSVKVEQDRLDGSRVEMVQLHDGAIFGEMALISDVPRSAHVVAAGDADLLRLPKSALEDLYQRAPELNAELERFTRERLLQNLLRTAPLFRPLDRGQRIDLARRFTAHEISAGADVISEGTDGQGLFVVLKGEVDVWKRDGEEKVLLATLRAGEVFGEMAMLHDQATTASVTTASDCTLLFLAKEYVHKLLEAVPAIRHYVEALDDQRLMDTRILLVRDSSVGDP